MTEESDHSLLTRWCDGQAEAGDALVQRHFRAVFRFFESKVSEHAEELTQQTFLACVEAKERIEDTRSFRAYLFGIARNLLLQHLTRHYKNAGKVEPHQTSLHDVAIAGAPGIVTFREDQRQLFAALARLPIDIQLTLELHYWWGMGVAQLAEITDAPVGTVKTRLFRGRAMLREAIESLQAAPEIAAVTLDQATRLVSEQRRTGPPKDL